MKRTPLTRKTPLRAAGWREVERLHNELAAAHNRIDELSALLGDLLNDCDNWGIAPHTRYEEALA